jgi:hypothetical protein
MTPYRTSPTLAPTKPKPSGVVRTARMRHWFFYGHYPTTGPAAVWLDTDKAVWYAYNCIHCGNAIQIDCHERYNGDAWELDRWPQMWNA